MEALLVRATSISPPPSSTNLEYVEGFRTAVSAAFSYVLTIIESQDDGVPPPVPAELLTQARLAARNSIGLDAVVRRYITGTHLLDAFIFEEIEPSDWEQLHRFRAQALDLLLREVSAEYNRAAALRGRSRDAEKLSCVEPLLNAEPADGSKLGYDMELDHVALVARGQGSATALRKIAKILDCRILVVQPEHDTAWAWLGRRRRIEHSRLAGLLSTHWDPEILLAAGESAPGISGWRRSHHQAQSAFVVARRGITSITHYRRDCLLASLLRDESLASLLWSLYIAPLLDPQQRVSAHLHTLRAYLEADRNGASAAAALGVSRQTVANHLRAIEDRIDTPLSEAGPELELALRLHDVGFAPDSPEASGALAAPLK